MSLTFTVNFESEAEPSNNKSLVFRVMKMKQIRKWSALQKDDYVGDKMSDMIELLNSSIVNISPDEFSAWVDDLYEVEFVSFLEQYAHAREEERKK